MRSPGVIASASRVSRYGTCSTNPGTRPHSSPRAKPGDTFDVIGGRIVFPPGREPSFSLYAMLAVLPFIPAKQRPTHPNDWMTTDTEIASPDPHCGARLRITRLRKRQLRHADYSAVPL